MYFVSFAVMEAGFVSKPEDYVYSSTTDYYTNEKGLIPIDLIDLSLETFYGWFAAGQVWRGTRKFLRQMGVAWDCFAALAMTVRFFLFFDAGYLF